LTKSYKKEELTGKALTVLGPKDTNQLGKVICHEHLLIDFNVVFQNPPNPKELHLKDEKLNLSNLGWIKKFWVSNKDNLLIDDIEISINELKHFYKAQGNTIVDVTSIGLSRNPSALKIISQRTGVNVIMGSGYYIEKTHPNYFKTDSVYQIAEKITNDILHGVDGTEVHSGIIGEIGCDFPWSSDERKSVHAGVLAQIETGAPILIHPGRDENAPLEIVNSIMKWGGNTSRTIMGHIERTIYSKSKLLDLANSGVYMNFDLFGHESSYYPLDDSTYMPSDHQRIEIISELIDSGFSNKILVGHDICSKHRLKKFGGHGWDHILKKIIPKMKKFGIKTRDIENILIKNPREILKFS